MKFNLNLKIFVFVIIMATVVVCPFAQSTPPLPGYELVFFDEFNDNSLNEIAWWPSGKDSCVTHGEGNCEEDMWYKPENITEQGGRMIITAKNDPTTCDGKYKQYSSGWVQTGGNFKYGYYEVRAKVPSGNGFWPAFWLTAPDIDLGYDEIDIFEFCGCDCNEFQAGSFYEIDYDGILANNTQHASSDINVGNNACSNYNIYGVEWTALQIKFYLNGALKATYPNNDIHDPMAIILNLAIGGCYGGCGWTYCGSLNWDTDNGCHVSCTTVFPQTFEIDWVRGWQKTNEALYFFAENEVCLGDTSIFRVPQYPNASYSWASTSGLQVFPDNVYLNYYEGIWKYANVVALTPGSHSVTVTITFPSGYVETKTHNIQVRNSPAAPIDIIPVPNEVNCCYKFFTPIVTDASSYIWTVGSYTHITLSNYSDECLLGGNISVSVRAQNACGVSSVYSENLNLPRLDCWGHPRRMIIIPNPASSIIQLSFFDADNKKIEQVGGGEIRIIDHSGVVVHTTTIEDIAQGIPIQKLNSGLFQLIFFDGKETISATFVKKLDGD